MFLTDDQRYLLSVLDRTACMRVRQAAALLRLLNGRESQRYTESALRQLRYLGKIIFQGDDVISLPYHNSYDVDTLSAIDVMLDMTERRLLAVAVKAPFTLCFLTERGDSARGFAVMTVPSGKEARSALLAESAPAGQRTVIFLLSDIEQRELIRFPAPHYFAVRDENAGYRYFQGQA